MSNQKKISICFLFYLRNKKKELIDEKEDKSENEDLKENMENF